MTYRWEKQRSAPPGLRHRPPGKPRRRSLCVMTYWSKMVCSARPEPHHRSTGTPKRGTLCVMTYRRESLRSVLPGPCHRPPKTPRLIPYALWLMEAKTYAAHHLDLVIGHLELLDAALYALWLIEAKRYWLDEALHALWLIEAKRYWLDAAPYALGLIVAQTLSSASSGPCHRPPRTVRRGTLWVMTYSCANATERTI